MEESPIFTKTFDLLAWLLPATLKFPRAQRFVPAQRVQKSAFDFYEALTAAALGGQPSHCLQQADIELQHLRLYLRLCHRLELLDPGQYEHVAAMAVEIGRLNAVIPRQNGAVFPPGFGAVEAVAQPAGTTMPGCTIGHARPGVNTPGWYNQVPAGLMNRPAL